MEPNENPDLDQVAEGEDVDPNVMDDAERDALAASQARGENKTAEEIQQEMLAAMNDPEGKGEETPAAGDDKTPKLDKDGKPVADVPADDKDKKTPAAATPPEKTTEQLAAEARAAVDAEANKLGLKGKAKERFHKLNDTVREHESTIAARDKQIETLIGAAPPEDKRPPMERLEATLKQHTAFEDAIFATGMSAQDFQNVAGYKRAIASDDPALWENARQFLQQELAWLETERMGIRPKDGKDPYTAHQDLADKVAAGAMDAEDANELARLRGTAAAAGKARAEIGTQTAAQKAVETAEAACVQFASDMSGTDAAQWAAKWPTLAPQVAQIRKDFPPDQWEARIARAYLAIPYAPAAVTPAPRERPRIGAQPHRGGGRPAGVPSTQMQRDKGEQTPFEALVAGMQEAAPKGGA